MDGSDAPNRGQWRRYHWWLWVGWALIALVITLSLVSFTPPVPVEGSDKYEHALAYATLMFWWGMLQPGRRWLWAVALPLMGVGMEFAQQLMPERHMDWRDALANTLGVGLALLVLATPLSGLLRWFDRHLGDRLDSRRS